MKVLVTGNAGFIGFHTAKRLLERGDAVVGFDSVNDYYDPGLKEARLAIQATEKTCLTFEGPGPRVVAEPPVSIRRRSSRVVSR